MAKFTVKHGKKNITVSGPSITDQAAADDYVKKLHETADVPAPAQKANDRPKTNAGGNTDGAVKSNVG